MRVLIIGANGRSGFLTVSELKKSHTPVAMIRCESQKQRFDDIGVETVLGDLEKPLSNILKGFDAVIFAAGSGSKTGKDKTVLIDHIGGIRAATEASVNGVKRFIMLSAMNSNPDSQSRIKHYHRAKAYADKFIMEFNEVMDTPLDWTIVCPGGLIDDPATNNVEIDTDINGSAKTSRAHVAKVLAMCLDYPNTINKRFALKEGATPLADAIKSL